MGRVATIQTSFNAGELSPRMAGRVDQSVYANGCSTMLGWLPLLQGPAVAAPGTRFVEVAHGPFRAIPFEYNVTQGYVIEASQFRFRFYTNDARIETSPGVPYEIGTLWSYDHVLELDYAASRDVLYLSHGAVSPKKLRRLGAVQFDIVDHVLQNGPFEDPNADDTLTVSASGDTGTITLTASAADFFEIGDVGGLFQIEAGDYGSTPAWEPGITVTGTIDRASDGKVFTSQTTGRTGTIQPTHNRGAEYDGMASGKDVNDKDAGGILWAYKHGRFGQLRITAFISGSSVTAEVLQRLPTGYGTPTWRWAFGAFSDRRGWPDAVSIWNERVCYAKGPLIFGSTIAGYDEFNRRDDAGDFQQDLAFVVRLPAAERVIWMRADRLLVVGTERGEYTIEQLQVQSGQASPPVMKVALQSAYGSHGTRPVLADGRVLFVQRAARKVLEMAYAIESDRYAANDLTRFADHLSASSFTEMAWAQEPERHLWVVRADGVLCALTYSPGQDVMGWARRQLGGDLAARTVTTITDPSGRRDQLWLGVQTGDAWWMLRMEKVWEIGDSQADAFMVDAGLTYRGTATSSGSGLAHLAGRTCTVLADGKPHPDIVIGTGGTWVIDYPASTIQIGLAYPGTLRPMSIEAGQDSGTAQGKRKRIPEVALKVIETQGLRVQVQGLNTVAIETRISPDKLDQAVPLFSGTFKLATVGMFDIEGQLTIDRFQPTPATLLAIIPTIVTGER